MPHCLVYAGNVPKAWVAQQSSLETLRTPQWKDAKAMEGNTEVAMDAAAEMGRRAASPYGASTGGRTVPDAKGGRSCSRATPCGNAK